MRITRVAVVLLAGVAACATPGQVRRVETAVAAADRDRARSDSAERAELARIQVAQRRNLDSLAALIRQLDDVIQRMNRDNASSFDALNQRLYQVVSLANTMGSGINRLNTRIENAVTSGVPVTSPANDSAGRNAGGAVPQPDVLIGQARSAILGGAFMVARRSLNQLLVTYPQAPEVPDAYYWLAQSFEQDHPDSARVYYARVFTTYPKAEHAPSALYKLGNLELKSGNVAAARRFWNQIVKDYPKSLEFDSARESLRVNP